MVRRALLFLTLPFAAGSLLRGQKRTRLPNGKTRELMVAAHDYRESTADAKEIRDLADQLYETFLEHGEHVIDVRDLRKLDRIDKLTDRIRSRMNRRK